MIDVAEPPEGVVVVQDLHAVTVELSREVSWFPRRLGDLWQPLVGFGLLMILGDGQTLLPLAALFVANSVLRRRSASRLTLNSGELCVERVELGRSIRRCVSLHEATDAVAVGTELRVDGPQPLVVTQLDERLSAWLAAQVRAALSRAAAPVPPLEPPEALRHLTEQAEG